MRIVSAARADDEGTALLGRIASRSGLRIVRNPFRRPQWLVIPALGGDILFQADSKKEALYWVAEFEVNHR